MKKIAIIMFAAILIYTTYNAYAEKPNDNKKDKEQISLKEKDNTLISDETKAATEEELMSYINVINNEVEKISSEELTEKDKDKLKNTFITLTDFIFYNGTIKGKNFNELSSSTKESIIVQYEQIDSKIENKIPGYKETIKATATKTYKNVKEKLVDIKNDILTSYKQEIGEENYANQEQIVDESLTTMKDSLSPTIDRIIEKSKETIEEAKDKADNWYQNWKEDNAQ